MNSELNQPVDVELASTNTWFQELKELLFEPVRFRLLLLCLMLGLGGASVWPVLSSHLVVGLGIEPIWVGIYFTCNTLAGVTISQLIARASDVGLPRTRILAVAMTAALFGAIALAWVSNYWLLLAMGMLSFGLSAAAQPQLFALSREQVTGAQAPLFQSLMRAQISLSWIVGPPLAYLIFDSLGFQTLMGGTVVLYGLGLLLLIGLKGQPVTASASGMGKDKRIPYLIAAIAAIFAANSMYIIYMPLRITQDLQLDTLIPGLLMGMVAALEIPIMIGGGVVAKRWPLLRPLWLASGAGTLFFMGFALAGNITTLAILQLFNAVFVGLSAGLGIVVFQTLMPTRLGAASTLFASASSTGALMGSSIGGAVAQWWGYQSVFIACALLCTLAIIAIAIANRLGAQQVAGPSPV